MSLHQTVLDRPPWVRVATGFLIKASLAPARVLATSFAAVRTRLVLDALIAFGLVILPMVGMVLLMFLLSSADPTTAVPGAVDDTTMLILPP
jgi:hypothetical protein